MQERINKIAIEPDALLVHGVVAAAERNNTGPGDREAVAADAVLCKKVYVLAPAVVGVCRNVAIPAVESLARAA